MISSQRVLCTCMVLKQVSPMLFYIHHTFTIFFFFSHGKFCIMMVKKACLRKGKEYMLKTKKLRNERKINSTVFEVRERLNVLVNICFPYLRLISGGQKGCLDERKFCRKPERNCWTVSFFQYMCVSMRGQICHDCNCHVNSMDPMGASPFQTTCFFSSHSDK